MIKLKVSAQKFHKEADFYLYFQDKDGQILTSQVPFVPDQLNKTKEAKCGRY